MLFFIEAITLNSIDRIAALSQAKNNSHSATILLNSYPRILSAQRPRVSKTVKDRMTQRCASGLLCYKYDKEAKGMMIKVLHYKDSTGNVQL